jgi:hypothetical protein
MITLKVVGVCLACCVDYEFSSAATCEDLVSVAQVFTQNCGIAKRAIS